MTIPNIITLFRLLLVPVLIVMIMQKSWEWAFILFVVAGISDAVDGFIARRFSMFSELGAYIDPLADKALLVSIYITLAIIDILPHWLAVLVVSRDLIIVAAIIISWLMDHPVAIKPLLISKLNTGAQLVFAALLLGTKAFNLDPHGLDFLLLWSVAALTLMSAAVYLVQWLNHMAGFGDA